MCASVLSAMILGVFGACEPRPSAETLARLTEAENTRLVDVVVESVRPEGNGWWAFEGEARLAADLYDALYADGQAALCDVPYEALPPDGPPVVRLVASAGEEVRFAYEAVLVDDASPGAGPSASAWGGSMLRDGVPLYGFPHEFYEEGTLALASPAEERAFCDALR